MLEQSLPSLVVHPALHCRSVFANMSEMSLRAIESVA